MGKRLGKVGEMGEKEGRERGKIQNLEIKGDGKLQLTVIYKSLSRWDSGDYGSNRLYNRLPAFIYTFYKREFISQKSNYCPLGVIAVPPSGDATYRTDLFACALFIQAFHSRVL